MKRFSRLLVAAGALAVGGIPGVQAQSSEIVTTGFATIPLTPTRATVSLSVATQASSAATAAVRNAEKVKAVMAAIGQRAGLVDSLRVTRIDVSPQQDYETHKIHGYEAEATIEGGSEAVNM